MICGSRWSKGPSTSTNRACSTPHAVVSRQHPCVPCACRSAKDCDALCAPRFAQCLGLLGEVTAFHAEELGCRLRGQKRSKGPSISPSPAHSSLHVAIPRLHTSATGAHRSAEHDSIFSDAEESVKSVGFVEGSVWSKGLSTSPHIAPTSLLSKVMLHTGVLCARRSADPESFLLRSEVPVESADHAEGSGWSEDPSTSPSTDATTCPHSSSRLHPGALCACRSACDICSCDTCPSCSRLYPGVHWACRSDCVDCSGEAGSANCRRLPCVVEGSSWSQDPSTSLFQEASRHAEHFEPRDTCILNTCWDFICGLSCCLPATCIPSLQRSFSPLLGVRIGEASNPGPRGPSGKGDNGGLGIDLSSLLGQDFSASIRKFIEQAIHKAIQDALQGMSLGSIGEIAQEQPGPKRRKRKHERANAPAPSNAPSSPHDETSKPTTGPGKGGKKGIDATVTPGAAGKGRGQEGGHKGKGKGPKGSAIKPPKPESGHEGDEWTTVSRQKPQGPWQLRDADWSAPTFNFDDVAEAIEKATGVFKAVVLCGPEQADLLATILLGSKKPHGVIAVTPDHPEASARCPGAVGNSCVFKLVQFHHISSAGVELPGPKVLATKAPKVVASKTAVMYVRVYKKYVAKNAWKDILANPQRAFHHWIAQQHMKVQDSWGWAKEQTQGEDSKIYALFRVPEADVAAFAALSGRDGFFIDPPRWTTFPAFSVQWAEKEAKETDLEFLQRVRAVESKFGVVVGRRGLGKRIARDANQAIPRTWLLEHAPFDWGSVQASKAVSTIFENVTMLRQQRTRKGVNFFFRAEHATEHDVMALPFEDGEMLWCRWAPVRAKPQAQTIRTNGSWSLLPPRDPFAETTKVAQAVSQDDAEAAPDTDASMEASSKQATSEGKEAKREATSKGKGVAKRVCTETRDLPKGVEQQQAPTDGSCLFHAASAAIAHILKCEPEAHSVLRAKVVQHFKKNSSRYEAMWDKELPDRSQGNSFQDYISAIAVVDTWAGPMELAALGRIYDIKFVIYPRSPDLEVCAVHVNQRKRVAALAFTGSHYEWLKPVSKLPQELCDVTTPPPQVPMRGGGKTQHDTASCAGSVRSVWTQKSKKSPSNASSVWTSSSPKSAWTGEPRTARIHKADHTSVAAFASVAEDLSCLDPELQEPTLVPKTPTERQIRYWGRAGLNLSRKTAVVCPLCPFRATAKDAVHRKSMLYEHYRTHHPGRIPSGVPHGARQPSIIKASSSGAVHWRCPLCTFGIPARDAFSKSADAVTADKFAHCKAAHVKVPWAKFKALDRKQTLEKAAVARRGRECLKRLSSAKGTELEGYRLFCWPRAAPLKTFAAKGGLYSSFGWMCLKCQSPFRCPGDALTHAKRGLCCPTIAKKKAQRRVDAITALTKAHTKNTPEGPTKARESDLLLSAMTIFSLPLSSA